MASANTIKIFQNDTSPNITFTITRTDGSVVNLTGCTVRLRIQDPITGSLTNSDPYDICTITNPTEGICVYAWNDTDLPDPGTYNANLQITYTSLTPESTPQVETYGVVIQVAAIV